MLKRQDSLARRPENQQHFVNKSIGCMSGIIQLISKYQKKTKRLTSGIRKQGKAAVVVGENDELKVSAARSFKMQQDKKDPLEEISCPPSSTEVKRRKLLEALEKCNDDLQSIRNILNSLKISDIKKSPNEFAKSKHNGHKTQERIKKLEAYEAVDKFTNNAPLFHMKPKSCSKGMIQSVEEVWNECEWGEKREAGRIGLILQDHICRELIEEFLKEMDLLISFRSLPFLACKKRLLF
ncbi:uncharacterized protein LOC129889332 isoform X2 [Solanum dulcamara]|uniref:uncharacterized protein LOC129889332 isoform X2 n=1 Tax=Solanum dulcamara TaxID=45834 RepID=UPI002485A4C9|nr:uncharacterized protein LOC129889332 isoform X2 [Solanum dulcamara]